MYTLRVKIIIRVMIIIIIIIIIIINTKIIVLYSVYKCVLNQCDKILKKN